MDRDDGATEDEAVDSVDDSPEPRRPSKRTLSLIVAPIIAMVVAGWIGDASSPYLVDHHPLWLIGLNARNRNLVLVTNHLDTVPYYLVGTVRLLLSDPLFYLLGVLYGDAALRWMEKQAPTYGKLMRAAEHWFGIASYPLVFLAPNNFICLFAGAAGMSIPAFLVLNVTGTVVRLYVIRVVGDIFSGPIDWFLLHVIQRYRWPLIALSVVLVAFSIWSERRQGGELDALTHLDEKLGEEGEA